VGIDIAKDKHHAFVGTANGETLWRRFIFTKDLTGCCRLIEQIQAVLSQHQLDEVIFGIEPTSNYNKPLALPECFVVGNVNAALEPK
jgi:transposase